MSIMSLTSPLQAIAQLLQMPVRIQHAEHSKTASPVLAAFKALIGSVKGSVANVYASISESSESRTARQQQEYLAEATDLYELEYRIKSLDRTTRSNYGWM